MTAIETHNLTKTYKDVQAVDDVTISLDENRIHGLLGRNGAGKTTLMQLLTGQVFATSGKMTVLGDSPVENVRVLSRTCFIQEGQKYPATFRANDVLGVAAEVFPDWDEQYAQTLVGDFKLPTKRLVRKLSRGQLSAVGIIVGLASRAELTFFDEPYMGLDVVARHIFYERLLTDFSEHPRTVVLSTHHIDEAANLLEHAVVLDEGRVILDADADEFQTMAIQVSGRAAEVDAFTSGRRVLDNRRLGALAQATVLASDGAGAAARAQGLDVEQVSLQSLVVGLTTSPAEREPMLAGTN